MSDSDYPDIDAVYRAVRRAGPLVTHPGGRRGGVLLALCRTGPAGRAELEVVVRGPESPFLAGYWALPGCAREPGESEGDAAREDDALAGAIRWTREVVGADLPDDPAHYLHGGRWMTPGAAPDGSDIELCVVVPEPGWSSSSLPPSANAAAARWMSAEEIETAWRSGQTLVAPPLLAVAAAMKEDAADAAALAAALRASARQHAAAPQVTTPTAGVSVMPLPTPTLPPATHTNCVILGDDEVVVVDPATPYPGDIAELDRMIAELRAAGRRVKMVLLTHHHGDHVGAAMHLAESLQVPIAAHARTRELLVGRVEVNVDLADDQRIELAGGRRIRALFTPGHAPGHLCFVDEHTGSVAAGDMVAGVGTILVDPSEGDMAQYLDSLRRLLALRPARLLPAHGPVITEPAALLEHYLRHRLWREERVVDALRGSGPCAVENLVPQVYSDVPAALHPLAARSLLAHLHKLRAESRAELASFGWRLS